VQSQYPRSADRQVLSNSSSTSSSFVVGDWSILSPAVFKALIAISHGIPRCFVCHAATSPPQKSPDKGPCSRSLKNLADIVLDLVPGVEVQVGDPNGGETGLRGAGFRYVSRIAVIPETAVVIAV